MVSAGKLVDSGRGYKTFQPNSLQEIEGELDISSLFTEITDATLALGELKAINSLLPNPDLLIEKYALREAVLSSQIEGTQSTMVEVLQNETNINAKMDIWEVRNYQRALKGDRFILCTDGFWGAMPEDEFVRHLSENNPINKILDSTANVVESIGRNSGNEYDNLTAAILEMNSNSILKEKMNKKAKLIIVILAVLLIVSIILNVSMLIGKGSSNGECNNVNSELMNNHESIQAKDSVVVIK